MSEITINKEWITEQLSYLSEFIENDDKRRAKNVLHNIRVWIEYHEVEV